MSTDDNDTISAEDEEVKEESFHIYIFSFSYGFLLVRMSWECHVHIEGLLVFNSTSLGGLSQCFAGLYSCPLSMTVPTQVS